MNKEDVKPGEEVFPTLFKINVSDKVEKKAGLSYLSWSYAWAEVKKAYPWSTYTIYENKDGLNYHHDGKTAWVKVGVTICGMEHIEYLPVMNHMNKSIGLKDITSCEVNKSIQRAITKAIARHGLGLYIYSGEDMPEESDGKNAPKEEYPKAEAPKQADHKPESKRDDAVKGRTSGRVAERKEGTYGFVTYKVNGFEVSTKKEELKEVMDKAHDTGVEVQVDYTEAVKGKYTNRYIDRVEVIPAVPF